MANTCIDLEGLCECDSDQATYSVYKQGDGDHNEKYETGFGDMMWEQWGESLGVRGLPNEMEALSTLHLQATNTV